MGRIYVNWVWTIRGLSPGERLTLLSLADDANNQTGQCWPGLRRIANETEQGIRTISRHISELQTRGFIRADERYDERGQRTTNTYTLLMTTDPAKIAGTSQNGVGVLAKMASPSSYSKKTEPEEEKEPDARAREIEAPPETPKPRRDHQNDPSWLSDLHEIPAWTCTFDARTVERVTEEAIDLPTAKQAALDLVSKWDGKKYKRADFTFIKWALGEKKRRSILSPTETDNGGSDPVKWKAPSTTFHDGLADYGDGPGCFALCCIGLRMAERKPIPKDWADFYRGSPYEAQSREFEATKQTAETGVHEV